MVWSYSDQIFQVIESRENVLLKKAALCFKNIIIDEKKSKIELYTGFQICMDFMPTLCFSN